MARNLTLVVLLSIVGLVLAGAAPVVAQQPDSPGPGLDGGIPSLGKEITISALDNTQFSPAVAYNWKHEEYLVVWQNQWTGNADIYAQRVTHTGELKSWFAVTAGANSRYDPSVAYDPVNDRYLVVWSYDIFGDYSDLDIWGRFIPWNGPDASLAEFPICGWLSNQDAPEVVYGRAQQEFMVAWRNLDTAWYISGRRVNADGSGFPAPNSFFDITDAPVSLDKPDVAYNLAHNEYLVTYDNSEDIFATRLKGDGTKLGGGAFFVAGVVEPERSSAVAACKEADQYLVVWETRVGNDNHLYSRFVGGDGKPGNGHRISKLTGSQGHADVDCNRAGNQYLVVWQETTNPTGMSGRLVNPDETLGGLFQIVAPGQIPGQSFPAVSGGDDNYLIVWQHPRPNTSYVDIHGKLVTPYKHMYLPVVLRRK